MKFRPHSLSRHLYYFCIFHPFINSVIIIILRDTHSSRMVLLFLLIKEGKNKTPSNNTSPSIKFILIAAWSNINRDN